MIQKTPKCVTCGGNLHRMKIGGNWLCRNKSCLTVFVSDKDVCWEEKENSEDTKKWLRAQEKKR